MSTAVKYIQVRYDMEFIKDRVPTYAGRVKLTPVSGSANVYDLIRDDSPLVVGTPINKALLNGIYGFDNITTTFNSDGSITQTDPNTGTSIKTTFNANGSITETMESSNGDTQTKTTTFNSNGSITEVVS